MLDGGLAYSHESIAGADAISAAFGSNGGDVAVAAVPRTEQRVVADKEKIGRNDPCWCGSGKKYKKCHGAKPLEHLERLSGLVRIARELREEES